MAERTEGPRFQVKTWSEGGLWHARVVPVRPEAAPFTDPSDEERATEGTSRWQIETAVCEAVAKYVQAHGAGARHA